MDTFGEKFIASVCQVPRRYYNLLNYLCELERAVKIDHFICRSRTLVFPQKLGKFRLVRLFHVVQRFLAVPESEFFTKCLSPSKEISGHVSLYVIS